MPPESTSPARPPRIGVWCDYGFTLEPTQGVGVFAFNLIAGLLQQDEPVEVVMLVGPNDQHVAADLLRQSGGRLRVVPERMTRQWRFSPEWLWRNWVAASDRLCAFKQRHVGWVESSRPTSPKVGLEDSTHPTQVAAGIATLIRALVIGLFAWAIFAVARLALAAMRGLLFPVRLFDRLVRGLRVPPPDPRVTADAALCDVWIIPYVGLEYPLNFPAVVVIHDLVYVHFPDTFADPDVGRHLHEIVQRRAEEATVVACMADFIRDNDLLGVLRLPPDKVHVVPHAAPEDLRADTAGRARNDQATELTRPYLFYPAGFRPYKNHGNLIRALAVLRDRHAEDGFDLVFTGYRDLPADLRQVMEECGLTGRVHVLQTVDRAALAALYRNAFAVVLPTLYEQGSFPLYEALHHGCPVACADIPALREQCAAMGDAMIYFDPHDPGAIARAVLAIRADRAGIQTAQAAASRPLLARTWKDAGREWLAVCREAVEAAVWRSQLDQRQIEPWPRLETVPATVRTQPEVFLFLHRVYTGGVWEATQDLVDDLVAVNRARGQLRLTLGLHENQVETDRLERLDADLAVKWLKLNPIRRAEAARMAHDPDWLRGRTEEEFSFLSGAAWTALRADAWLALVDRFPLPLLPARPYGVVVYDMIQRHVPHAFDGSFHRTIRRGMAPTIRGADLVLTTTPQTRADVLAEYGLDESQVRLIPVACNPERRFGGVTAQPVERVQGSFLLNVTNAAPHKGADVMLRGFAGLKHRLGPACPRLVVCGWDSQQFAAGGGTAQAHWLAVRRLVEELGLRDHDDVIFLGYVNDRELLDLYQRCEAVVNAALYDNGSFSLLEAAYFGRRVVSARYPAVEYLCERFGVAARLFTSGDGAALAAALAASLREPPPAPAETLRARARFAEPEYGTLRYAERVYDALLELVRHQRQPLVTYRPCA